MAPCGTYAVFVELPGPDFAMDEPQAVGLPLRSGSCPAQKEGDIVTFEDETAKSASNALRELLNGAICGGHCGDEDECSHYDATDRALSALSEAGYTVVKTDVLAEAQGALREATITALTVKPLLDKPYPDDPRWTPWTRWVDRAAARCFDARRALAKSLPSETQRRLSRPVPESDTLGGGANG